MMKMLVAMLPTLVLVIFSQLATKWRVQSLHTAVSAGSGSRLAAYLSDVWIWAAYGAAFLGGVFWMFVVERYPLSLAFPIYIGLTVLSVSLGSVLLFGEAISLTHGMAILLILAGVALALNA